MIGKDIIIVGVCRSWRTYTVTLTTKPLQGLVGPNVAFMLWANCFPCKQVHYRKCWTYIGQHLTDPICSLHRPRHVPLQWKPGKHSAVTPELARNCDAKPLISLRRILSRAIVSRVERATWTSQQVAAVNMRLPPDRMSYGSCLTVRQINQNPRSLPPLESSELVRLSPNESGPFSFPLTSFIHSGESVPSIYFSSLEHGRV